MQRRGGSRFLVASGLALLAVACGRSDSKAPAADGPAAGAAQTKYPEPRWPSYFKPPEKVEDLMPAARALVRNRSGLQGSGLGVLKSGESVLIVINASADPLVIEAVKRALIEREVNPHFKTPAELQGGPAGAGGRGGRGNRDAETIRKAGIYQASSWITGQFPDPSKPRAWLKERRPDLYKELFPGESEGGTSAGSPQRGQAPPASPAGPPRLSTGDAIKAYLTAHPEVRGVFWGSGGTTGLRRQLFPMQQKYLGTFLVDNVYDLQSMMSTYPGDVWQLAEEQLLEPIAYASGLEITDPEGTNIRADITEDMARRWAQGVYQRGHLYMFPNQATGRFGYSMVDYPAFNREWLAREPIAKVEGVIAGTQGHGGFFPRWEVVFKDGFISEVRGGGPQGDALREFLNYPGLNDLVYPYHTTPGYWYLYEIAFGSHPKGFRHPLQIQRNGSTIGERIRSGVIHWGLGIRLWHDPDAPTESKKWAEFTEKHNVPRDHGWHTHTYFTTYKLKLRNTDKWATLLDKGRMTSLDDPEVRALASRYGDPDYLLAEDWIPEVPGINAPGDYLKDYANAPGNYAFDTMEKAMKGTYDKYFPKPGANITIAPSAPPSKPVTDPGGGS